jgi:flagellar basal-body rod modification protein FlgD
MATTDLVNGLASAGSAAGASSAAAPAVKGSSGRNTLSRDDFYKIMISELTNQDPFQPVDNQQFLQQLSSLQTLDATGKLTDGIDKLVLGQQLSSASSLIGKTVKTPDGTTGNSLQGTVQKVQVQGSDVELLLDGNRKVKLSDVTEIA